MNKIVELTGKVFGKLTVLKEEKNRPKGARVWNCKCECGNEIVAKTAVLLGGYKKSCGCLTKEVTLKRSTKHGLASRTNKHPLYSVWNDMKRRCYSKNREDYQNYGGRGIKVCDRWLEPNGQGFLNFLEDMGERPDQHSIERINNNGPYSPENCKWATRDEQANNLRKSRHITYKGKTQTLSQWARELGMNHTTILIRLKNGWSVEDALSPVQSDRKKYIEFNGEVKTIKEWAKNIGISYNRMVSRLNDPTLTLEDALTKKPTTNDSRRIFLTFNDETLSTSEWSARTGISKGIIWKRHNKGWSPEQILSTPLIDINKYYTFNGVTKSHQEWAKDYKIKESTLRYRLKKGLPLEEALTNPVRGSKPTQPN